MRISNLSARGKYHKTIEILTNDPRKKEIRLTINADFVEILSILPSYIYFEQVPVGSNATKELIITNKGPDAIAITRIIPSNPRHLAVNTQIPLHIKPGEEKRVRLTITAGKNPQHFSGALQFIAERSDPMLTKTIVIRADFVIGANPPPK